MQASAVHTYLSFNCIVISSLCSTDSFVKEGLDLAPDRLRLLECLSIHAVSRACVCLFAAQCQSDLLLRQPCIIRVG